MSENNPEPQKERGRFGGLTTPLSLRGVAPWLVYVMAAVGAVYLINPTAGLLELIPDNIPFVGNLDDGGAALLIWYGLIEYFEGRKFRQSK